MIEFMVQFISVVCFFAILKKLILTLFYKD
jgi:hypothetical protein